jgi:hypothetical protein
VTPRIEEGNEYTLLHKEMHAHRVNSARLFVLISVTLIVDCPRGIHFMKKHLHPALDAQLMLDEAPPSPICGQHQDAHNHCYQERDPKAQLQEVHVCEGIIAGASGKLLI